MKLLLIDDSADVLERLIQILSPLTGIEMIAQAADIPDGLPSFRAFTPDVVLLDLRLPSGSGIEPHTHILPLHGQCSTPETAKTHTRRPRFRPFRPVSAFPCPSKTYFTARVFTP